MRIPRPKSVQPIPKHAILVYSGVIFDVYQWQQQLFDGRKTTFEKLKRRDTVVVVPVLPDGRILLTAQEHPGREPFIAATGGTVNDGETLLQAARRELMEETGYEAAELTFWYAEQPIAKIEWALYTFIAKRVRKVRGMGPDSGERIKLKPVSFDEFLKMSDEPRFLEREMVPKLYKARCDAETKEALRTLLMS